jgi:putative chitinase
MSFEFKEEHLAAMIPSNRATAGKWFQAMKEIFPKYEINTPNRIAGFLAQCDHESAEFKLLEENLNYSEKSLNAVFGRYFGPGKRNAAEYARKPEKIANYVYQDEFRSSKMGNTKPGDGWLFRGRGLKQLTGRENYTAFGKSVGMTAEQAAEYVATEKGAIESACWFWNNKKLNAIADTGDIVKLTKVINGGTIGLDDRKRRWEQALKVLGGAIPVAPATANDKDDDDAADADDFGVLRRGSRGEGVKLMQAALGVTADGVFGPGTERVLKEWQTKNGLTADGIAGPKTLEKLLDD